MSESEIQVFAAGARSPEEVLQEAGKIAAALKDVVVRTKATVVLGNSEHLKIEAWQTLAKFYGLVPRIRETRYVSFGDVSGFDAVAELVHVASGSVVSSAEAMCCTDEEKWRSRPKYEWRESEQGKRYRAQVGDESVPLFQLRSMAQTRAISKVCANALRWVVVLAGYDPTPAEEMDGDNNITSGEERPERTRLISDAQRKRMYAMAKHAGWSDEQIQALLASLGFLHSADVTRDKYEAICDRLSIAPPARQGDSK